MLKWVPKKKDKKERKEGEEKETPLEREDLENIGLSLSSKSSSNISIHNENGTYISHASIDEIKRGYGTIHEYLKQRFGPGRYTITVRGKGGEDTQHISIAGEESPTWPENPVPGGDSNQLMGIYLTQQTEIARLKAEVEAAKGVSQQSMLGSLIPNVIDFIKTMMQSRPDTDLASVMTAATDCLKTLSEIKTPGEKSDDVGGLMGGIAQLLQGVQARQQQSVPNPVFIPPPHLYPATPPFASHRQTGQTPAQPPTNIFHAAQPDGTQPKGSADNGDYTDIFFENLSGMVEQKQNPGAVASYIIQSIQKLSPQEMQQLDPQMQLLVGQLQSNPVAAFDAICQIEPSLAADGKYTTEIRAELQKIVQG